MGTTFEIDEEIIDERIEELLALWGVETDEDADDYDGNYVQARENEAYNIANSFPSAINIDLFIEIYEARGGRL